MKSLLIAGIAILAIAATDATASGKYQKMKGSEIKSSLVGNSLRGADSSGKYVIYFSSNQKMRIVYTGKKKTRIEKGVWWVMGNKYCRRWEKLGKGQVRCVTFIRNGNRINWVHYGETIDRSVLLRGNPARL
mgnify:CR=1 FL=1